MSILPLVNPAGQSACGQLASTAVMPDPSLVAGSTTWLSVRVHVPGGDCPGAYPVLYIAQYLDSTGGHTSEVGGFNDLADVTYPSCTSTS